MAEPRIYVLAGTNGAGKSSVLGEMLLQAGTEHFNPDDATRRILARNPDASLGEANGAAWAVGKRLLEKAIAERLDFAIETTLAGETFVGLLEGARSAGMEIRLWYVGLASPELHIARVASRVSKGGHHIPEAKIRERFDRGREHLIRLLPVLTEMKLYDNSVEADPDDGEPPQPKLLLHAVSGSIRSMCAPAEVPAWAKPILAAALKL